MIRELIENNCKKPVLSVKELKRRLGETPIVLYGAGGSGTDILEALRKADVFPVAFSDTDSGKWHTHVSGLEVVPHTELSSKFGRDISIIACFYLNAEENMASVRRLFSGYGITSVMHVSFFMCCPELFLPLRGSRSQLEIFDVLSDEQREGIDRSYGLMSDDRSKALYRQIIGFRCFLQGFEPLLGGDVEYFAFDHFAPKREEIFVDCGAYVGDTLREFLKIYKECFRQYIAFEPDPDNFRKLSEYACSLEYADRIRLSQTALSDSKTTLRFDVGHGISSVVSQTGNGKVFAIPLDAALNKESVSFIKIDVEGYERNVLLGAEDTIERCRPVLAVSVYHMLNDIWQLPLLLDKFCRNYKFFLYAPNYLAGPCVFAVPAERLAGPS